MPKWPQLTRIHQVNDTPDLTELHGPATHDALANAWRSWGRLDEHVIGHLVNPSFMGGPRWPGLRQAHVIARRDDALLVASDGLADPIEWTDAPPSNGFGVEVYGIAEGLPTDADTMTVAATWLTRMVMTVSNTVAGNGTRFLDMLEHYGSLTMDLPGVVLPDEATAFTGDGRDPCVLLGLDHTEIPTTIDGPLSTIRLVNVKLLTAAEADYCVQGTTGVAEARGELARLLKTRPNPLRSSLDRQSVV